MKRILTLLFAGLATIAGNASAAGPDRVEPEWYDIEVVVFRHLAETSGDAEWWPDDPGHPDVGDARALSDIPPLDTAATTPPDGPRRLSADRLTLSGIVDALEKNAQYSPLLHLGWSQPAAPRDDSPLIRIGKGELAADGVSADRAPGNGNTAETESPLDRPPLRRPLDGTLRVAVNRYVHVWADLLFHPQQAPRNRAGDPDAPADDGRAFREEAVMDALLRGELSAEEARLLMLRPDEPVFLGYRLRQHRRMRSGELHYIDHPKVGIILRATPRKWQ